MSADCSCCRDTRFAICLKTCFSSVDCGHACSPLRQSSSHSDTEHCIIRSELGMLALPCPGNEKRLCFSLQGTNILQRQGNLSLQQKGFISTLFFCGKKVIFKVTLLKGKGKKKSCLNLEAYTWGQKYLGQF